MLKLPRITHKLRQTQVLCYDINDINGSGAGSCKWSRRWSRGQWETANRQSRDWPSWSEQLHHLLGNLHQSWGCCFCCSCSTPLQSAQWLSLRRLETPTGQTAQSSALGLWKKSCKKPNVSTGVKRCTTDGQSIMNGLKQGLRNRNHRSTTELSKPLARSNANSHEPLFEVLAIFQQARSTWLDGNLGNQNQSFLVSFHFDSKTNIHRYSMLNSRDSRCSWLDPSI